MQNKGAIRLLAIALVLVVIYQLSFTFFTNHVKKVAKEKSNGDYTIENAYLDSMANEEIYNFFWLKKYTYADCEKRQINLGLDLRGGMNVILQVSVEELLISLSNNSQNPTFLAALEQANEQRNTSQKDYISLFGEAFKKEDKDAQLSSIFYTPQLRAKIEPTSTNDEILKILAEESKAAIDNSFNILRTRIDRFGVAQPNIQELEGHAGRILIELPGIEDEKRVRDLLQRTAQLEFYETYDVREIFEKYMRVANNKIKIIENKKQKTNPETNDTLLIDTLNNNLLVNDSIFEQDTSLLANLDDTTNTSILDSINDMDTTLTQVADTREQFQKDNPLFALLIPITDNQGQLVGGAGVGIARKEDIPKINDYLNLPEVKAIFPRTLKFMWTVKHASWDKSETYYELVAIKTNSDGTPQLTGDVITNARADFGQAGGSSEVSMSMNGRGAKIWAKITKENVNRQIAIVLDGDVYSYPNVTGEIQGGNSQISGNFTIAEAQDLANVLKSGKLPISVQVEELNHIGPSLGKESINSGLTSFIIAFVIVLIYMMFYYKGAGVVANIALIANVFFIIGVLASLGAVLTLPGIAGIVLTIGMSVDANVIIYERIKEELRQGKGIKLAVKDGYKHAYSAIIDANVTTLLTGIVLYIFGHGPIQGFATTLVIGILTSLFSAIFITRLVFQIFLDRDKPISFSIKLTEHVLQNSKINFLGKRKIFYIISGAIILLGAGSLAIRGLNQGVDFVGGRSYVVRFSESVNTVKIAESLQKEFETMPEVKTYGSDNQVKITTKYKIASTDQHVEDELDSLLHAGLIPFLDDGVTLEKFVKEYKLSTQKVGPTIARDIKRSAIWSVLASLLIIFMYIFIRFKNWQYGLGATAALLHDTVIVISIFSLLHGFLPFSLEIDQAFIAAILTVVGYSVNDTVVVFDRVREYFKIHHRRNTFDNINGALNSTLSRTLNTSITTSFVLLAIFVFGGEVIRGFVFALLIGVLVGTYSSLFIATPLVFDTLRKKEKKKAKKEIIISKEVIEAQKEKQEQFHTESKEEREKRVEEAQKNKEKRMRKKRKKKKSKK